MGATALAVAAASGRDATGWPLRTFWMPRTMTSSPASGPAATSTSPCRRWPSLTSRRSARSRRARRTRTGACLRRPALPPAPAPRSRAGAEPQLDGEEQARLQRFVGIVEHRVDAHRARRRVDAGVDDRHLPSKTRLGKAERARDDAEAGLERAEAILGHREVELDLGDVVERRDHAAGLHQRAEADLAHADAAVEGRGDAHVVEARVDGADLALRSSACGLRRRGAAIPSSSSRASVTLPVFLSCLARSRRWRISSRWARACSRSALDWSRSARRSSGFELDQHRAGADPLALARI